MIKKVSEYIERHGLIAPKDKLIVALSGGADSVAMLHILWKLGYNCCAIHCNFHLRGMESMRDEEFVRQLCDKLNIPLKVIDFDTQQYAKEKRLSIEMAARELRYDVFEKERKENDAQCIAVAHHRDDSAETVLLNLIRGTGIRGLHGIRPKNGYIVRPMLSVDRKDIIKYIECNGLEYVTDSTNLENEYMRNKIRLDIIPLMQQINPAALDNIASTAENISTAEIIYDKHISECIERVMSKNVIDVDALKKELLPETVLYEILSPLGFNAVQARNILRSIDSDGCKRFYGKGWEVIKDRNKLLVTKINGSNDICTELPLNGKTALPYGKIETSCASYDGCIIKSKDTAMLDADTLALPLMVRNVKEGDRFVPFGMRGSKLVSDYMTDKKFDVLEKSRQLAVVDAHDTIVWLVNERPAMPFCVSRKTKNVLYIKWDAE
ncbi:MAG: tRNA lysidine(34) synthetase TilS [Bacteroidaceae bacterium]|nr:tRNA lysidine(34) synthetase TilS [Bacteroidaceae bacterium]